MSESEIQNWVDRHWEVAAAMLESGAMDEMGEWQSGQDWRRGLEAYRERLGAKQKIRIKSNFHPSRLLTQEERMIRIWAPFPSVPSEGLRWTY